MSLALAGCTRAEVARAPAIHTSAPAEAMPPAIGHPPDMDTALKFVGRFIVAESVGNWWAADTLVARRSCAWSGTTEVLPVTTAFHVQPVLPMGESARVQVIYDVAGIVWLAPAPVQGRQRTRFAPRAASDTVVYRVFADSTGRLWMACGNFQQNHVAVSQLHEFVERFDDSARLAWQAVFPRARH